jgi:hypothetical protein
VFVSKAIKALVLGNDETKKQATTFVVVKAVGGDLGWTGERRSYGFASMAGAVKFLETAFAYAKSVGTVTPRGRMGFRLAFDDGSGALVRIVRRKSEVS